MRFQSGITDQYIYFVAVDATDLKTRETGLSSFTVYRSRNGGAATAYTTPTVAELSAANMPGVYSLLLDEDMTIDSGDDSQAVVLHITQASMAPVTLMYELYRPVVSAGGTLTVTSGRANADVTHIATAAVSTSTAQLGVNVVNFGGSAGTFASGRPEVNTSHIAGSSVSTSSAQIGVNVVNAGGTAWASGSLTSGVFATGAITAGAIAADAIGASELAADAIAEIADAVWDEDATAHQTTGTFGQAIGDPGANTETLYKAIVTDPAGTNIAADIIAIKAETATILADTNELQTDWVNGGRLDNILDARASQASVDTIDGIVDSILVDTAEIGAAGAGLTALPWNAAWDAEVQSEVDDALVAQNLDHLVKIAVDTNFATTVHADSVIGQIADNGAGFDRTTDSLEAIRDRGDAAWATATGFSTHSAADVWAVGTRVLTSATNISGPIADQVWEEAIADHSATTGSTAEALAAAGSAGDPWATALPGAYGAGTAGKIIGDNINATISSRATQTSVDTVDDFLDTEIAAIKAKTDNLPSDPADASDIATRFTTLDTSLATVDTVVDAIKVKTDSLTFTVAGQVDANIQYVNDIQVTGNGQPGTEWGP